MTQQLDEATLRAQLAEQYQHLEAIGLNELSSGNVSCRVGDNMLISPSGATGSNITPEHVVEVTLDGASNVHPIKQERVVAEQGI